MSRKKKVTKPSPAERGYAAFKDGALSAMLAHGSQLEREAEERIRESLVGYIDARRSGWLMRDKVCCELFERFATWLWARSPYAEPKTDFRTQAVMWNGAGVNYCPFCGVKL